MDRKSKKTMKRNSKEVARYTVGQNTSIIPTANKKSSVCKRLRRALDVKPALASESGLASESASYSSSPDEQKQNEQQHEQQNEHQNKQQNEQNHKGSTEHWPFSLVITHGSILHFEHPHGAIVNAANESCTGGGGVDGAISVAGGKSLRKHRTALPVLHRYDDGYEVRGFTGQAKMTGPGNYGRLGVGYVIHAVGPAYGSSTTKEMIVKDELLRAAYWESMMRAKESKLEAVGFSLISAGVFRGRQTLEEVLRIGLEAICDFGGYEELKEVHMYGFMKKEIGVLQQIADEKDFLVKEGKD